MDESGNNRCFTNILVPHQHHLELAQLRHWVIFELSEYQPSPLSPDPENKQSQKQKDLTLFVGPNQ